MCIQDNPRYINLVRLGMSEKSTFSFDKNCNRPYCTASFEHGGIQICLYGKTPEDAFDTLFTTLEKYYAPTYQ